MELISGKYTVAEIDGVICSIAASVAGKERMNFLKEILELNGYIVKTSVKKEGDSEVYTVGVTDLVFNPVLDVYKRRLKSKTGHKISPAYWLQKTTEETELQANYWKQ